MSRPLRIEYRDAWYHVMNRGRRGDDLFLEKGDYLRFKTLLKESSELWNVNVCAYCLMPNHYHLLVQTPQANLSRFMRHLNGIYTQRFNRHHKLDGQLFRGRYKSILVGEADYLIELLRYIHFNPVRAQLVKEPPDYPWSSIHSYLTVPREDAWINTDLVFDLIGRRQNAKNKRTESIATDASKEILEFFSKKNTSSILGSGEFVERIRKGFFRSMVHPEIPDIKKLSLDAESIIKEVCRFFGVSRESLNVHHRSKDNTPRDIAMYMIRMATGQRLADIGTLFQMEKYGSVSSCINRVKRNRVDNRQLAKTLKELESKLR